MFLSRRFQLYCIVSFLAIAVSHAAPSTTTTTTTSATTLLNRTAEAAAVEIETTTTAIAIKKPVDNVDKEVSLVRGAWNWFISYMRSAINVEVEDLANESLSELISDETDAEANIDETDASAAERAIRSMTTGRTFGKIRRLQMALIPIVFKFGVISAMVTFLVLLGMKSLFLLKILVLMNFAAIVGKFLTWKADLWPSGGHSGHAHGGAYGWNPYMQQSWGPTLAAGPPQSKEIHLHLHGLQAPPYGANEHVWNRRSNDPYSAAEYASYSANLPIEVHTERNAIDELSNADKYNQNYVPQNHRNF